MNLHSRSSKTTCLAVSLVSSLSMPACQQAQRSGTDSDRSIGFGPINISIDHVTIAGRRLEPMREGFGRLSLETEYGGAHGNGITHMALLGFDDGSYIELISTLSADERNIPLWKDHIVGNAGPCGWAVRCDDVAAELRRAAALGVAVRGPFPGNRRRPSGTMARWNLGFVGDRPPGATLPFIIEDTAPRANRVQPSPSVADTELTGVAAVIIGVVDLEDAVSQFRRVYGWSAPWVRVDQEFGATLARFQNTPVILASALEPDNWLARRLERLGEAPCAVLIGSTDIRASCERFGLSWSYPWLGHHVAWFDEARLQGTRLGLID